MQMVNECPNDPYPLFVVGKLAEYGGNPGTAEMIYGLAVDRVPATPWGDYLRHFLSGELARLRSADSLVG
jgi:hypothetical protein